MAFPEQTFQFSIFSSRRLVQPPNLLELIRRLLSFSLCRKAAPLLFRLLEYYVPIPLASPPFLVLLHHVS